MIGCSALNVTSHMFQTFVYKIKSVIFHNLCKNIFHFCLQKLLDRIYGIHKIHSNYGRVFSEWSGIEKEMSDGLQTAGHYMDV